LNFCYEISAIVNKCRWLQDLRVFNCMLNYQTIRWVRIITL